MDPVFTLQWTEYLVVEELAKHFTKKDDYSILIPASRQEKGIDLGLIKKRESGQSRVALIQVKASRTYVPESPKRITTVRYTHYTWFNRFEPSPHSDFFLLVGLYAPDVGRTKPVGKSWYRACMLLFTFAEMKQFIENCNNVGGGPDGKFGFGFDTEAKIVQTRGNQARGPNDFTDHLLRKRLHLLHERVDGRDRNAAHE